MGRTLCAAVEWLELHAMMTSAVKMMDVYFRCPISDGCCGWAFQVRRFAFATQDAVSALLTAITVIVVCHLALTMLLSKTECIATGGSSGEVIRVGYVTNVDNFEE